MSRPHALMPLFAVGYSPGHPSDNRAVAADHDKRPVVLNTHVGLVRMSVEDARRVLVGLADLLPQIPVDTAGSIPQTKPRQRKTRTPRRG